MKMYYERNYKRIIIAVWTLLLLLVWLQYIYLSNFLEATCQLLVFVPAILLSLLLTNVWLPKTIKRKQTLRFIFLFIVTLLFTALIMTTIYQLIQWAVNEKYITHFTALNYEKNFGAQFLFLIPSILVINFGFCGLRSLYEHMKLQRTHLETQLQVLQSQINPHFMFNILNHIHILMQTNVEMASSLLLQYSDILRYQLYYGKNERVTLQQEVQFLKGFIEVERVRWGNKIEVSCQWNIENEQLHIPPLLFITFVENAFKHVSRSSSQPNFITIHFTQEATLITLEIENSMSDVPPRKETSGLGLENVKNRLDILYHDNFSLTITDQYPVYHTTLKLWQNS